MMTIETILSGKAVLARTAELQSPSGLLFGSRPQAVATGRTEKTVVELDMGEASREEGFRLNGCR